jgi:large subunit ribosomal protein L30
LLWLKKSNAKSSQIKVVQVVSLRGSKLNQKQTLIGLGLNKIHKERVLEDTNSIREVINKVRHLVKFENVQL